MRTYISVGRTAGNAYLRPPRGALETPWTERKIEGKRERTTKRRWIWKEGKRNDQVSSRLQVVRRGEGTAVELPILVLSSSSSRKTTQAGERRNNGEDGRVERDETNSRIRAHTSTYMYVYVHIWVVLAGIRHPINLLLANRLANCERMLARANKGASIY